MSMHKKHYVLIALAVYNSRIVGATDAQQREYNQQHVATCYALAEALQRTSPTFNYNAFLNAACEGIV